MAGVTDVVQLDLATQSIRDVNAALHAQTGDSTQRFEIINPQGSHNVAVGLDAPIDVQVRGHVGYYVAGMNKQASVTVHGNAGKGAAENMMSGTVRIKGNASDCAGATGHGGLLVIEGDAASRCGISMKGNDIVVGGSVGHVSGFMAQAGTMVICGDAGAGLGDSLYEAVIYVRGEIAGLGADAQVEDMTPADVDALGLLLDKAQFSHNPGAFKRVASARTLYHWDSSHPSKYG